MTAETSPRGGRITRLAALPAALLTTLAFAGAASGSAEVGTFHDEHSFSDAITDFPCFEDVPGTISGTETVDGRFTQNGPPAFGFHASGVSTVSYRVDFADGRYVLGTGRAHFAFNATARQHKTDSDVGRDRATAYAPDGQPIGPLLIHATYHVSFLDTDADDEPDPGEFTTRVDRFRVSCPS